MPDREEASVLVVVDDPKRLARLKEILEQGGHHVRTAETASVAFEAVESEPLALALVDMAMSKRGEPEIWA